MKLAMLLLEFISGCRVEVTELYQVGNCVV